MAQTTILAAATAAGTSTDVVIAAGATVTLGVFTATDSVPGNEGAAVYADTPGSDLVIAELTGSHPVLQFVGPCTLRVKKGETSAAIGVFSET
jgi:hypothetical protein